MKKKKKTKNKKKKKKKKKKVQGSIIKIWNLMFLVFMYWTYFELCEGIFH